MEIIEYNIRISFRNSNNTEEITVFLCVVTRSDKCLSPPPVKILFVPLHVAALYFAEIVLYIIFHLN